MLTFTHHVNDALDLHSYSLKGTITDYDDTLVYVGEHTSSIKSILKSLQYYVDAFEGVSVEYATDVQ